MKTKPEPPDTVNPPCWRISPPRDFCEFLRRLPNLLPEDSILSVESGGAPEIEEFMSERPATYDNEIDQGFWRLRPKILYMPITEQNLRELADLCEKRAEPEVSNTCRRTGRIK